MACFGVHRDFLNVGYELTEKQLRTYFVKVGFVSDIHLPRHRSERKKGFGFATFDTAEALRRALLDPRAAPQAPNAVSLTPNGASQFLKATSQSRRLLTFPRQSHPHYFGTLK